MYSRATTSSMALRPLRATLGFLAADALLLGDMTGAVWSSGLADPGS